MYDANGKRIPDDAMNARLKEMFDTNATLSCHKPGAFFSSYKFRLNARNADRVAESVALYKRAGWETFTLAVDGEETVDVTAWVVTA